MNVMEFAREIFSDFSKSVTLSLDEKREKLKSFSKEIQNAYYEVQKASFFDPANAKSENQEIFQSDSGHYRLVVTPFETSKGSWNYTQGLIYRNDSNQLISEVQRNYSSFPYTFIEDHPNGHSYLVCGADYQGQTVIELDTGKRKDHTPKAAEIGAGFCWVDAKFIKSECLLVVSGCVWACPYEHRFYDFSDPMNGWEPIEFDDDFCLDDVDSNYEFGSDGTICCKQFGESPDFDDDNVEVKDERPGKVRSTRVYKHKDNKFIFVSEWVSDEEKAARIKRDEEELKYKEEWEHFKSTDPLYLSYKELVKDPDLSPDDYESKGITYKDWCPHFSGTERRFCRRIIIHKGKTRWSVDLEWATLSGPIKLCIFKDGNSLENVFFEHSVSGMEEAFAYAKKKVQNG